MGFLRSNTVFLRPVEPSDVEVLLSIENDSDQWMQSENYLPFSREVIENYTLGKQDLAKYGQYRFIICSSETNSVIGAIDLFDYNAIHSRAGVGIYIIEDFRNKGLATSALSLLAEYAAQVLNIELLHCSILESNSNSIQLFKRNGFVEVGVRQSWTKINGQRKHVVLLQRLS